MRVFLFVFGIVGLYIHGLSVMLSTSASVLGGLDPNISGADSIHFLGGRGELVALYFFLDGIFIYTVILWVYYLVFYGQSLGISWCICIRWMQSSYYSCTDYPFRHSYTVCTQFESKRSQNVKMIIFKKSLYTMKTRTRVRSTIITTNTNTNANANIKQNERKTDRQRNPKRSNKFPKQLQLMQPGVSTHQVMACRQIIDKQEYNIQTKTQNETI